MVVLVASSGSLVNFSKYWKARCSALSRGFWRETTPDTLVPPVARLSRLLSDKLPTDEIFIYPAMGDDGEATGGALCYLLQQYISPALIALS